MEVLIPCFSRTLAQQSLLLCPIPSRFPIVQFFSESQASTETASTDEKSASANPHSSFVILESFVEDAFVMEAFISGVRVISILNQRRGEA